MSYKIGDKIYLNLEEQVCKNVSDIENLFKYARATLKIVGKVTSSANLPDPATYTGAPGDVYQVGTGSPYTYYAFTGTQWISIGEIKGEAGEQGETGPAGPAPTILIGDVATTTVDPDEDAQVAVTAEQVDDVVTLDWDFEIPKGPKGDTGEAGADGVGINTMTNVSDNVSSNRVISVEYDPDDVPFGFGFNQTNRYTYTGGSKTVSSYVEVPIAPVEDELEYTRASDHANGEYYKIGIAQAFKDDQEEMVDSKIAAIDSFVEKTSDTSVLYGTDNAGAQTTLAYSGIAERYTIPQRDGDGNIQVGVASSYADAVSKAVMDAALADKLDKTTTKNRVYITNGSGEQSINPYAIDATNGSFAVRGSDATLKVGTPTDDTHAATKKYVDDALANKLDVSTSSGQRVYAKSAAGDSITIPYAGTVATANSVVVRDGSGHVVTAEPTEDTHSATKKYVDDTKEPLHTVTRKGYTLSTYTPDENNIIELDIGTTDWRHIWGYFTSDVPAGTKWYIKSGAEGVTPQKQTKVNYAVIDINYLPMPGLARPYRVIETTIGGSASSFSSVVASTEYLTLNTLCVELPADTSPAGVLQLFVEV